MNDFNNGEIIIYQGKDGLTKIDVKMENETVWLTLAQMSDLFDRNKSTISRHIKNIFEEGELMRDSVVANFATTAESTQACNLGTCLFLHVYKNTPETGKKTDFRECFIFCILQE